ncbi:hypothetical protein [Gilliamella sp. ESL0232]|uniref:hypothetical protein n=1 Tax=Gilliamella sp. ESL0232 TaxID=2705037 RepID=UPI001EEAC3D7|nr:hypothetical protein [Gilliamella sp. ESL0232]
MLVLALLLLSSSWDVQANGKKARAGNRSDAIIIPSAVINYVRPNLYVGEGTFAGQADIWNPDKGFLVQSINPESYYLNFPTTGAHNLYFDLLISGVDINKLTWEPVTHEGIIATVTNVVANDWWLSYEDRIKVVRVTLTGPRASDAQIYSDNPSSLTRPSLPQTFELVGKDRDDVEVVKYGFVLRQWFVNRGGKFDTAPAHTTWCNSLGYRMPRVRDLTNAKCGVERWFPCMYGVYGAMPSSDWNGYRRHIGAGFFTEWGVMNYYSGAGFAMLGYWTSDEAGSNQFRVYSDDGYADSYTVRDNFVVCTTP